MIVAVTPEDWVEFREIRLRALADAPDAFGATLAEAQEQTEEGWRSRLASEAPILLVRDGGKAVAMGGAWLPHVDRTRRPWTGSRRGSGRPLAGVG